jgi:hypothetical protein
MVLTWLAVPIPVMPVALATVNVFVLRVTAADSVVVVSAVCPAHSAASRKTRAKILIVDFM